MKHSDIRTPLAKVRGLGSAHDGTTHFIRQRLTAIVLIPLTFWFISSLLHLTVNSEQADVAAWLSSGFDAAALIIMLLALFYHAAIGMQVIIEDYVHCTTLKMLSLLANALIMFTFTIISILAVLKLHFIGVVG